MTLPKALRTRLLVFLSTIRNKNLRCLYYGVIVPWLMWVATAVRIAIRSATTLNIDAVDVTIGLIGLVLFLGVIISAQFETDGWIEHRIDRFVARIE